MPLIEGPTTASPQHKSGFVVVAVGEKRMIVLTDGSRLSWGERTFGGYKSYYQVDVGPQLVRSPSLSCCSKQTGLDFNVIVDMTVQVDDPIAAVRMGLKDPALLLMQTVRRFADQIARKFKVEEASEMKGELEQSVREIKADKMLRILDVVADVRPDAKARELLSRIAEEDLVIKANEARMRVDRAKRDEIVLLLDDPNAMIAQAVITKDDTFKEALHMKLDLLNADRQRQIELLKMLIDSKAIEPHDLHDRYGGLIEAAIGALKSPNAAKQALPPTNNAMLGGK